jgi:hypothetical protein
MSLKEEREAAVIAAGEAVRKFNLRFSLEMIFIRAVGGTADFIDEARALGLSKAEAAELAVIPLAELDNYRALADIVLGTEVASLLGDIGLDLSPKRRTRCMIVSSSGQTENTCVVTGPIQFQLTNGGAFLDFLDDIESPVKRELGDVLQVIGQSIHDEGMHAFVSGDESLTAELAAYAGSIVRRFSQLGLTSSTAAKALRIFETQERTGGLHRYVAARELQFFSRDLEETLRATRHRYISPDEVRDVWQGAIDFIRDECRPEDDNSFARMLCSDLAGQLKWTKHDLAHGKQCARFTASQQAQIEGALTDVSVQLGGLARQLGMPSPGPGIRPPFQLSDKYQSLVIDRCGCPSLVACQIAASTAKSLSNP